MHGVHVDYCFGRFKLIMSACVLVATVSAEKRISIDMPFGWQTSVDSRNHVLLKKVDPVTKRGISGEHAL